MQLANTSDSSTVYGSGGGSTGFDIMYQRTTSLKYSFSHRSTEAQNRFDTSSVVCVCPQTSPMSVVSPSSSVPCTPGKPSASTQASCALNALSNSASVISPSSSKSFWN